MYANYATLFPIQLGNFTMSDQYVPHPGTVTADELRLANDGPALAVNRMIGQVLGPNMRLAFLELYLQGEPARFRTAISLSLTDALALSNLVLDLLNVNPDGTPRQPKAGVA